MPVWGDRFVKAATGQAGISDAEASARGRLLSLVYDIESIPLQDQPSRARRQVRARTFFLFISGPGF